MPKEPILGEMVIAEFTHSYLSNSFLFVSFNILGGHCLYNDFIFISPPVPGEALTVTP